MTVSSQTARADYNGNGITDDFAVPFRFLENGQLRVLRTVVATGISTTLTLDAGGPDGYTVSGAGVPSGGMVSTNSAPAIGTTLSILRNVPVTQEIDYLANDPFPAETHERGLDKLTMIVQQQIEVTERAVVLPPATFGVSTQLPAVEPLKLLRWSADGTRLENGTPPEIATVAPGAVVDATVSPIAGINSAKLAFLQTGTTPVTRAVQDKLADMVSAFDFMTPAEINDVRTGAMGIDVTAKINAAISSSLLYANATRVYLPPGVYRVDGTILMRNNGSALIGAGRQATILKSTLTTNPMITFTSGINNAEIRDLWLDRVTPGTGNGFGIDAGVAILGESTISNVRVTRMSIGMNLGCTDHSIIKDCIVSKNTSHGIRIYNSAANASQWSIDGLLSQTNDGYGVLVVTIPGFLPTMSVGSFRNVNTFANTLGGIWVLGSASCSVEGFRLDGFFVGEEGNDGVFLDTYNHIPCTIRNGYAEIIGRNFTGSSFSTPASLVGRGIHVSANNAHVDITNVISTGNSFDGFLLEGYSASLTGCSAISNGASASPTASAGIRSSGTCLLSVTGGKSGNTPATAATQTYGVFVDNGSFASVLGVDLTTNTIDTHGANTGVNSMMVIGCLGALVNRLPYLSVGSGAGAAAAGVVNAGVAVQLNGVPYTHP